MRIPGRAYSAFLLPLLASATGSFDCSNLVLEKIPFDLSKLGGARSVIHKEENAMSTTQFTYTIDICRPLGKVKDSKIPLDKQCAHGSRVCAITRLIKNDTDTLEDVFAIAGELNGNGGTNMNAIWTRLKTSQSAGDVGKEGLRVEMNGGFKMKDNKKRPQKAIIEFLCDHNRTGLEHLPNPEDHYDDVMERRDEGKNETVPSLEFFKYGPDADDTVDILRLNWRTEYACEDSKGKQEAEAGNHWGFFTWFIIVAFLGTAAYLIFGSWLNYNRYGARGWDLVPHGDTIRDVPYLLKDWMRRVVNTVQGPGSRGGYAAV